MSVTVKQDGSVIVRASNRASIRDIEKFVDSKSAWVKKHLAAVEERKACFSSITDGRTVLIKGKEVPLRICAVNAFGDNEICVKSVKNLKKLLIDNLGTEFLNLFEYYRNLGGFDCGGVEFKNYKSRWGCCDRDRRIFFNYKLLMLPEELWALVIAHELCHTVYMDHSLQFHKLLQEILPSCGLLARRLKRYSPICSLY